MFMLIMQQDADQDVVIDVSALSEAACMRNEGSEHEDGVCRGAYTLSTKIDAAVLTRIRSAGMYAREDAHEMVCAFGGCE